MLVDEREPSGACGPACRGRRPTTWVGGRIGTGRSDDQRGDRLGLGAHCMSRSLKLGGEMSRKAREVAKERWPIHKPVCYERRAVKMGTDYARAENRGLRLTYASHDDDTRAMQKLIDGLVEAAAAKKTLAKHSAAAVRAFVDSMDPRNPGSAAYGAAQEGFCADTELRVPRRNCCGI